MTIDERIDRIEDKVGSPLRGTQLTRTFFEHPRPEGHFGWTLGIGLFSQPLEFFTGDTIEEVVTKAEVRLGLK